jgi:hypothetical protein
VRVPPSLRCAALIVALAGGLGSVGLMLDPGRRNHSVILLVLFTVWVFSPFMGLISASVLRKSESLLKRAKLYGLILVLTVASLTAYAAVAFGPRWRSPLPFSLWCRRRHGFLSESSCRRRGRIRQAVTLSEGPRRWREDAG